MFCDTSNCFVNFTFAKKYATESVHKMLISFKIKENLMISIINFARIVTDIFKNSNVDASLLVWQS